MIRFLFPSRPHISTFWATSSLADRVFATRALILPILESYLPRGSQGFRGQLMHIENENILIVCGYEANEGGVEEWSCCTWECWMLWTSASVVFWFVTYLPV